MTATAPEVLRAARGAWRRRTRDPFIPEAGRSLLVHCSHHKAGTVWVRRVLRAVASDYGLRMDVVWANPPRRHTDIAFVAEARHFDRTRLPSQEFRGTHMVRDPRDMIVSGYFYHLWTTEDWAQEPRAELGGLSYREHLNQLDVGDGLTAEIERAVAPGGNIDEMLRWDYHSKEFLELRYEDFIADEQSEFARLFRHYGFTEDAIALGVARGERYNFKNISRRNLGEVAPGQHLRSGRPGSWREHFGPQHREAFKALTGDLLVALGYEENQGW